MLHTTSQNQALVQVLSSRGVRFLVVGGLAVQHYCEERETQDLDLLVEPTLRNARLVIASLTDLGFCFRRDISELTRPAAQISLHDLGFSADLLTPEQGVAFGTLFERSQPASLESHPVLILSKIDLIASKKRSGRETDLKGVEKLQACGDD